MLDNENLLNVNPTENLGAEGEINTGEVVKSSNKVAKGILIASIATGGLVLLVFAGRKIYKACKKAKAANTVDEQVEETE